MYDVKKSGLGLFFSCSCPVFPTPFVEETFPLDILASFVED